MESASHGRFYIEPVLVVLLDGVPELFSIPSSNDLLRFLHIGRAWDPVLQSKSALIRVEDVDLHCVEQDFGLAD